MLAVLDCGMKKHPLAHMCVLTVVAPASVAVVHASVLVAREVETVHPQAPERGCMSVVFAVLDCRILKDPLVPVCTSIGVAPPSVAVVQVLEFQAPVEVDSGAVPASTVDFSVALP